MIFIFNHMLLSLHNYTNYHRFTELTSSHVMEKLEHTQENDKSAEIHSPIIIENLELILLISTFVLYLDIILLMISNMLFLNLVPKMRRGSFFLEKFQ